MVDRNFYLVVAALVALIVAIGFGRTVDARLLHPPSERPLLLYVHATMFSAWVLLYAVQAALVRFRRVSWHRRLGVFGIGLGALMPLVGVWTAVVMARLHRTERGSDTAEEGFLIISFFDMLVFAVLFGLAAYWRRRPDYHRRLMLMASCGLTVAAFARFPDWLMPRNAWYGGVDGLILAGAARDWIVTRRIHPVYVWGLPALIAGQSVAMWIYLSGETTWLSLAHTLLKSANQ